MKKINPVLLPYHKKFRLGKKHKISKKQLAFITIAGGLMCNIHAVSEALNWIEVQITC